MIFARPTPARAVAEQAGSDTVRSPGVGNQARLRRLAAAGVQPKLQVGEVDDPLEREADRMADRVMAAGAPPPAAPRPAQQLAQPPRQTDAPIIRRKITASTNNAAIQISNMINDFCPASAKAAGTDVTAAGKACAPPAAGPGCKCACEAMTSTTKTYDINLVPMIPLPVSKTLANKTTTMVPQLADGPHTKNPLCTPLTTLVIPRFDSTAVFGSFDAAGDPVIGSTPRILAHELCGHAVSCFSYLGDSGDRPGHDTTIKVENDIYSSKPQRGTFKDKRQGESFFRAPGETKLVFNLTDGLHYEDVP